MSRPAVMDPARLQTPDEREREMVKFHTVVKDVPMWLDLRTVAGGDVNNEETAFIELHRFYCFLHKSLNLYLPEAGQRLFFWV
jgi:hypothetical protein